MLKAWGPTHGIGTDSYLAKQANLLNFWGITYLVGKIKFKLLFQGPLAKWGKVLNGFEKPLEILEQLLELKEEMLDLSCKSSSWKNKNSNMNLCIRSTHDIEAWNQAPFGMYGTIWMLWETTNFSWISRIRREA